MIRKLLFIAALCVVCVANAAPEKPAGDAAGKQYWQLTISYDAQELRILDAQPFKAPDKTVRTPGIKGALIRLDYDAEWLDGVGKRIEASEVSIPIGWRSACAVNGNEERVLPESDVLVIRMEGPAAEKAPKKLRLKQKRVMERVARLADAAGSLQFEEVTLDLPEESNLPRVPGPISSTKVRHTGPDSNRVVIVVMGDGYTAANLASGQFTTNTNTLLNAFTAKPPFDTYFDVTNVYRVDVESNEAGADEPAPGPGTMVDTYLNASFWTSGIERLLAINSTGRSRAIAAANALVGVGIWDDIFVLVNSTKYGGSGGSISVSSINSQAPEIIIHEYGHTFVGLADEYEDSGYGQPTTDPEANVDFQYAFNNLKWNVWVEQSTPLPTPETSTYNTVVGAFEGCKYWATGVYRPWNNCVMRSLNRPFCPVCKEATVLEYTGMLSLADTLTPATGPVVNVAEGGTVFSATALNISPITYEWYLGGVLQGSVGNTYTVYPNQMPLETGTLSLKISHPTLLVRKTTAFDSYTWNLQRSPFAAVADWSLFE